MMLQTPCASISNPADTMIGTSLGTGWGHPLSNQVINGAIWYAVIAAAPVITGEVLFMGANFLE